LAALAAPTPRLELVPDLLVEEPPVPIAVLALPLPVVELPAPTVEELWAHANGAAAITATTAAAERSVLLCIFESLHRSLTP
jgi:hypothetical protein